MPRPRPGARPALSLTVAVTARCLGTLAVLLCVYYLLPVRAGSPLVEGLWLALQLVLFAVLVGFQMVRIATARHPRVRAIQALAALVPLFLIVFARVYLQMSNAAPAGFSTELDRTRALYFTVTVFATVGFGDITPTSDAARLLVTGQMLLNLVVLGATGRLLFGAAKRSESRRRPEREPRAGER